MKRKANPPKENLQGAEFSSLLGGVKANDLPEGYKETELGPMPNEWQVVKLNEVLNEVDVRYKDYNNVEGHELPILSLTKDDGLILQSERFGKRIATEDVSNYKIVCHGQIVNNPYVIWEGAIHVLEKYMAGLVSPVYPVWEVKPNIADPWFVDPLLRMPTSIAAYNKFASGAVNRRRAISKNDFLNLDIPLPPLAEQRAIAHVLQTVQRAKEATEGVIAALKDLKKSLMSHLFTYGPVPISERDRVELQETELGPIPAHWQVVRLGEVAKIRAGVAFPHKYQGAVFGDYPFYKVSDMNLSGNEIYMEKASNWVNCESLKKLKAKLYPPNTIIFPKVGGALLTNKKRLLCRESLIDNNIMGVIVGSDKCLPHFCFYWFESIDIRMFSNPGPLPSINAESVKKSAIPLPPLAEQQEIARILQTVDAKIQAEQARREALQHLFQSMLHHLMTASVRLPPEFIAQFQEKGGDES